MTVDEGLRRAIGPLGLTANGVNLAVGAGVFALPAAVAATLGAAAVLAYLLCAFIITCVLMSCAELGSGIHRSGGVMAQIEDAFGPFSGFLAWALYVIGCCVVADAAIAHVLMDAVASGVPGVQGGISRAGAFAVLFGGLAAVNVIGVRYGTGLSVVVVLAKVATLLALVLGGLFAIDPSALRWSGVPSSSALGEASLLVFFIFMSAEGALTASGEIRNPRQTVPIAMMAVSATLAVLYISLQIVSQGVLGDDLAKQGNAPLVALGDRLFGEAGRVLVIVGTALAVFGSVAADMVNTPRALFAVAHEGLLPASLKGVHARFRTPYVAILVYASLVLVVTITGAFRQLAVVATISQLLIYLALCVAALQVRRRRPRQAQAFRIPGGPAVPFLGAVAILWLLSNSTSAEIIGVAAMLVLATAYYRLRIRVVRAAMASVS